MHFIITDASTCHSDDLGNGFVMKSKYVIFVPRKCLYLFVCILLKNGAGGRDDDDDDNKIIVYLSKLIILLERAVVPRGHN